MSLLVAREYPKLSDRKAIIIFLLLAPIQNNTFYWTPLKVYPIRQWRLPTHNYTENTFPIFLLLTVFDCCFFRLSCSTECLNKNWTELSNHRILQILLFEFDSQTDWFHVFFIVFSAKQVELFRLDEILFRWSQTWSLIYFSNQIYPVWRRWKRLQIDYYTLSRIGNNTPTHTERSTNILRLSIHTQTCIHCMKGTREHTKKKKQNFPFLKIFNCFLS